ncbi:hypothetical protein THAOC_24948 [Thalassiosira oceanica]|uniref:Uncharacterized protein n=1 Tax=Thalassiosira oceanica TaxID=159749 RepID=K0S998_THAOC|nr:hypothetical protein THAOC_24948 [Thalassiosira oceanica]|eukprot:EJK55327.1 hypothetical protein THAOC_24948 [Thalassiosira oceanica]
MRRSAYRAAISAGPSTDSNATRSTGRRRQHGSSPVRPRRARPPEGRRVRPPSPLRGRRILRPRRDRNNPAAAVAPPPPPASARRARLHHRMASRLVQVLAVLFVLSMVASVGHFAPGSATRLVLGARMPDFSGVDASYGTVLRGEDVREPEPKGLQAEGSCSDVLLFLPGAGNAGGPPDLASQLRAYVVASLAATYTDMALVLLDDANDSTSVVGCPDDTVQEHGSSFRFNGHYKIFPGGLSTLVRHPAWLSRGCGPPCPGSYGYGDWLRQSRSAAAGGRRDGHPRRRVGPVRGVREQRVSGHVGVGLHLLPPAPARDGRPDERRVDPEGARLGRQPGCRRGRGGDHVDAAGRGRHHGLRRGPRGPDRDTHAPALDLAGPGVPGAPRGVPRQVLRGAVRDAPRVRRDGAPLRCPGGGAVPPLDTGGTAHSSNEEVYPLQFQGRADPGRRQLGAESHVPGRVRQDGGHSRPADGPGARQHTRGRPVDEQGKAGEVLPVDPGQTSGLPLYFSRAVKSADTWARNTDSGSVTFLFDNHQADVVNKFGAERPWIAIRHVEGTDKQGEYKGGDKKAAFAAQHLKTRAVFEAYLTGPIPDWVCYLDDDMRVNVAVLKEDLLELSPSCSPNCLIAHGELFNEIPYTVGGYCMQSNLVKRLATLFATKTDAELGWTNTDDVDFNKHVMQDALGVTVTNSERWYSEYAFPEVDEYGDFHKHSMHELSSMYGRKGWNLFSERKKAARENVELMARFVPNVAVYHMGYEK